jgi:hypothetical protein
VIAMRDEELVERVREGVRRLGENPEELWQKLIREGVIDQEGKVLVRMPEPPAKKKSMKPPKSANGQQKRA